MLRVLISHHFLSKATRLSLLSALLLNLPATAETTTPPAPDPGQPTAYLSTPAQSILNTKLLNAAIAEDFAQVKSLMAKGAQTTVKHPWKDYHTPLTAALASGFGPIARYMLDHENAEPTERALFYAARLGDVSIVNTVLERLTKEDAKTGGLSRNYGRCELTEAVKHGRLDVVKRLYPLQLEVCGASIETGIKHNRMAVVQWLLSQQSEADQANRSNQTHWLGNAFESGSLDMIRYVQSLGIPLDNQITAYAVRAAQNDQLDIFEYLITQGYEFDTNPNVYSEALNNAISGGAVRVIDYLIAQGVSLNKPGACSPPLHSAIRSNQQELFFKLAKLDTPQSDPCSLKNPLHIAFYGSGSEENVFLLDYNPEWRLAQDADGNTPLHSAISQGAKAAVGELIKFGARNLQNAQGQTPLMLALQSQDAAMHKPILSPDSDLNLQDAQGKTALHYLAERWGDVNPDDYIDFLSQLSPAQINAQDFSGMTALATAIRSWNSTELIVHLLALGGDATIASKDGQRPLDLALWRGDRAILAALGVKPSAPPKNTLPTETASDADPVKVPVPIDLTQFPTSEGNTALHAAVRARSAIAVNYVLENKIPLDSQNQYGDTALQLAIKIAEPRLVDRLLKAGATIHSKNRDGRTPLHTAIAHKRFEIAMQLLQQQADVNALARGGWTPLHFAAVSGHQALVSELLKRGAIPNRRNWGNNTPAMLATEAGHPTLAAQLAAAPQPAMTNGTDAYGNTPLIRAVQNLDIDAVSRNLDPEQLNTQNQYHETPLSLAIWGSNDDEKTALTILQLLLKSGADIEKQNPLGSTALYFAIRERAPDSVTKLLLEAGAKIDIQDNFGISAIQMATRIGNTKLVSQLLNQLPALLNQQSSDQQNLLHIATANQHPELMRLLIDKGIDVNAVGRFDFTALNQAVFDKQPELVKILVDAGANLQRHPAFYPSMVLAAAKDGQFEILNELMDNGATTDPLETDERSQLLRALADKGEAAIPLIDKVLTQFKLFEIPGFLNANQSQLLYQAIEQDSAQLLALYQKHGLTIKLKSTAHAAVTADAINSLKYLMRGQSDLNQLNDEAQSLLHTAVIARSAAVTEWLSQQANLNTSLRDNSNATAMDYFGDYATYNQDDIVYPTQFLKQFPNAGYSPDLVARVIDMRRYKVARLLLETRNFSLAAGDDSLTQKIIIGTASDEDSLALLQLLLSKGAALPADGNGRSILVNALGRPQLFDFLLSKRGTAIAAAEQWDLLSTLVKSPDADSLEVLRSLQAKGWNLTLSDQETGNNPLHELNRNYYDQAVNQALVLDKFDFLRSQLGGQQALYQRNKAGDTPLQTALGNSQIFTAVPTLFDRHIPALADHPKPILKNMVWVFDHDKLANLERLLKLPSLKPELLQASLPDTVKIANAAQDLRTAFPYLIEMGANPTALDRDGKSLVHHWMATSSCQWNLDDCLQGLQYLKTLKVDFTAVSNDKVSPLHLAMGALIGDNLPIINLLIAEGVSPNIRLPNGETPLHLAASKNQAEQRRLLKALLQAGADINAQNQVGDTPFHLAIRANNTAGINYFLSAGKLKNIANKYLKTPLHELVTLGNADWVKRYLAILAEQNEAVSQPDAEGETALHLLALQDCNGQGCATNAAIGQQLLDAGIAVDARNKNNETPFFMTAYSGNLILAKLLHEKADPATINQLNRVGNAALHVAYYQKHTGWLEWVLSHGGDWNLKNWEDQSINQLMVKNKDYPLALLAQSLPISAFDWRESLNNFDLSETRLRSPALLYSMLDQQRLAVPQLPEISLSQMVAYRHKASQNTLLHIAAQRDYRVTVNQLLKAHHPVDWLNEYRETALHLAVGGASPAITQVLLASGASPNLQDPQGVSPLLRAVRNNQLESVAAMLKMGANTELSDLQQRSALLVAVETGKLEMVSRLLEHGAAIQAIEEQQHTPLIHAVWYYVTQMNSDPAELQNRMALIDLLLDNGADLNARDELDRTALHISMPIYELAQHLLSKGARADTKNSNGESPFFQAIRTRYPGVHTGTDFIRALVKAGADVNAKNKDEVTPLHLAVSNSRLDLLPVLTELGADVNMRIRGVPLVSHLISQPQWSDKQALITELLKHQLNLNVHDNVDGLKGKTPLHHAIESMDLPLILFLLKSGSDPMLLDKNGLNALHTVARMGNFTLSNATLESLIAAMLEAGLDMNAVDYDNRTALHHAVMRGSVQLSQALLAKGIDPNAQSIGDHTALQLAIERLAQGAGNRDVVEMLIKVTDLNIRDVNGQTVLHQAYAAKDDKLVQQLIAAGVDVTIRDYGRRLAQ